MSITKVNDTLIHKHTNIDKTYQCKSRKLVKHKILKIINGNPEITKRGRPITKREHENSPTRVSQNGMLFHGC